MATDTAALQEELLEVRQELAQVRSAARQLWEQIGGRESGSVDNEDMASAISTVEEQEALMMALEARHERLLGQLSAAGVTVS